MLVTQPAQTAAANGSDNSTGNECEGSYEKSADLEIEEENVEGTNGMESGTAPDPYPISLETEVVCDAANLVWKARVRSIDVTIITTIGVIENVLTDGAIDDVACDILRQMAADVADIMSSPDRPDPDRDDYWVPDGFLEKHEAVHNKHLREALKTNYDQLVKDLEEITLPCADYSRTAAAEEMEENIDAVVEHFHEEMEKFKVKEREHDPEDDFLEAHQDLLQPWAEKIDQQLLFKGC